MGLLAASFYRHSHNSGDQPKIMPYIQGVIENGQETDKNVAIFDETVSRSITREFKVQPMVVPVEHMPDTSKTGNYTIKIDVPSRYPLGSIQQSMMHWVPMLRTWFALDETALRVTYPGSSRMMDMHGGCIIMTINCKDSETVGKLKYVMSTFSWPGGVESYDPMYLRLVSHFESGATPSTINPFGIEPLRNDSD
jgi:hypothetical protein